MRKMFSKKQIKEIANDNPIITGNASISGNLEVDGNVNVDGKVESATLKQLQANYSREFELIPSSSPYTNLTVVQGYNRLQQINQKLSIVINFSLTNDTESSMNLNSAVMNRELILPEDVASKIYDIENKKVSEVATAYCLITATPAYISTSKIYSGTIINKAYLYFANSATANNCQVMLLFSSSHTLPAGSTLYVSARLYLDLI